MQNYVQNSIIPPIENMQTNGGPELLMELNLTWEKFKCMRKLFCRPFNYLDRFYVPHHSLESIGQSATKIFIAGVDEKLRAKTSKVVEVLASALVQFIDEKIRGHDDDDDDDENTNSLEKNVLENVIEMLGQMEGSFCHDVVSLMEKYNFLITFPEGKKEKTNSKSIVNCRTTFDG